MGNTLQIRRGSGAPTYTDFAQYELAYDYTNDVLYIRDGNAMVPLNTVNAVDTSGTPIAQEYARFTDANTIEGRSAAGVRTDLGLVIGTNVLEYNAELQTIAALNPTATEDGKVLSWNEINEAYELVAQSAGTITSVSGMTNNNVLTASGSTTISGESNLTFDASDKTLLLDGTGASAELATFKWYQNEVLVSGAGTGNAQTITLNATHGTTLNILYRYKITLTTRGTGTDSGAVYIVSYNEPTTTWEARMVSRGGSGSNHPELHISGSNAKAYHNHVSNYYINYSVQSKYVGESDGTFHNFGADYHWQRDVDTLSYSDGDVNIDSNTLFVDASTDRVGIGVSNPSRKLQVEGAIELSASDDTLDTNHFALRRDSSGGGNIDVPGDMTINIDANNNETNAVFEICANGNATGVFKVGETGIVTTGTWQGTAIDATYIGGLPASKITSGEFDIDKIPTAAVTNGDINNVPTADNVYDFVTGQGYLTSVPNLDASKITSGTFNAARIAHNSFDIGDTTAETERNVHETGIYTFNRNNGTLGTGTDSGYYSVLAFGQGVGGSAQIGAKWYSGTPKLYFRTLRDVIDNWQDWQRLLTTSDEGSGNGLDADTLDGNHASAFLTTSGTAANSTLLNNLGAGSFLRSDANDTASGALTFTGRVIISDAGADGLHLNQDTGATTNSNRLFFTGSSTSCIMQESGDLSFRTGATVGSSSGTERFLVNTSGATAVGNLNVTGNTFMNYGLVVNENANDADFRVESQSNANMFRVDASTSRVGIGTGSPSYTLDVVGTVRATDDLRASDDILLDVNNNFLYVRDASGTLTRVLGMSSSNYFDIGPVDSYAGGYIRYGPSSNVTTHYFYTGGTERLRVDTNHIRARVPVKVEDGTASTPSYTFWNDTNTGFYRPSTDMIGFTTAGTEKMRIDSSGNVGIGTTLPNHLLEIEGQTNDTEVVQISNDAGGSGSVTGITHLGITHFPGNTYSSTRITAIENGTASYTGHLAFSTRSANTDSAPAERMRIASSGNVGIGTISPTARLHISENGGSTDDSFVVNPTNGGNRTMTIDGEKINVTYSNSGGAGPALVLQDNGGNVGIGTTSPAASLEIESQGNARTLKLEAVDNGSSPAYTVSILMEGYEGRGNGIFHTDEDFTGEWFVGNPYQANNASWQVGYHAGTGGQAEYKAQAKLYVDGTNSRVGIGTTSPQRKLHVSTGNTDIAARFENTTSNGTVMELISSGDSSTLYFQTDHIYGSGNLYLGGGTNQNIYRGSSHTFQVGSGNTTNITLNSNQLLFAQPTRIQFANDQRIFDDGGGGLKVGAEAHKLQLYAGTSTQEISFLTGGRNGTERAKITNTELNVDGNLTLQSGHYFTAHNESSYQKYDMYAGNGSYCIGMYSGNSFGGLNDWAMTFTFYDTQGDRGFLWRSTGHSPSQGAMSLTTGGKLSVAHSTRIGYGISDTTTSGATYALDVSGSIGATADVVAYVSSDKRLKDNIKNIANPLEKLEKLNGVEFDWNDKQDLYKGHDIGVIAQEVEEVLPEIVDTREDGHKAVKYDRMVALLIEAVKEQQQQINELKEKLNG